MIGCLMLVIVVVVVILNAMSPHISPKSSHVINDLGWRGFDTLNPGLLKRHTVHIEMDPEKLEE